MEVWRDFLPRSVSFLFSEALLPLLADVGNRVFKTNALGTPGFPCSNYMLPMPLLLFIQNSMYVSLQQQYIVVTQRLSIPVPVVITSYGKFINWYLSFGSQFYELCRYDPAQGIHLLLVLTRLARPQNGEKSSRQYISPGKGFLEGSWQPPLVGQLTSPYGYIKSFKCPSQSPINHSSHLFPIPRCLWLDIP